ncbi:MAG TPA: IS630 family transposase [Verrucomicrobiae bacterium]|jgi:transposase|nr:IS630 family transposase [Verrucomicrobiae bacterium]
MAKIAAVVQLSEIDQHQLEKWIRAQFTPQQVVLRSRILLLARQGKQDLEIASELEVNRHTPALWRRRFHEQGLEGLWEIKPGRGRKPFYGKKKVAGVVEATLQTKPQGMTHWSCRTMARAQGVSKNTINRLWQEYNLKPHLSRTFKLSRDVRFLEKLTDVVGLYLNPPEKSLVLCLDEKSQIQALDRTQPGLPLKKGRCGTYTHDYVRHGTTTLFAALEILDGKVIGQCYPRHRHQEFLKFLRQLDDEFPEKLKLHLVLDNYGTHKHPRVRAWLAKHPRFVLHFIPTSSSWLNQVERWFGELTQKAVRRAAFINVPELQAAIEEFLRAWNENPRPFVWTATAQKIMDKINRGRAALETIQPGWSQKKKPKKGRKHE